MNTFYNLNKLLCRCLEVMNILLALPLGATIYVVSVDYITRRTAASTLSSDMLPSDVTINVMSMIFALMGILLINGSIAQMLDKRRFLEYIAQSVDDLEQRDNGMAAAHVQVVASEVRKQAKKSAIKTKGKTKGKKGKANAKASKKAAPKAQKKAATKA